MKKTVLISGCSSDLGLRSATALALRGHRVFAGIREPDGRGRVNRDALAALRARGAEVLCLALDVDSEESVAAAVAAAGEVEVLVNTAAYSVLGPLEACRPDQLLDMLNTNVVGALRLFRGVLPGMRARRRGRIIQLTSGLGRAPLPFMGIYSASAWAQECFAEVLSYEAAVFGVEVAILEPAGYREGGQPKKVVGDQDRLDAYQAPLIAFAERVRQEPPAGDPEEVAAAVVQAVEADKMPLRTPVGAAAEALVALRAQLTAAEYEREILERTGLSQLEPRDARSDL
ncbi:SDR family NAD(P)-dependent oxidoreductase [Myxococcota bacterium]|nr:SDR family NAD(P)-dependent oxidoreductase [Myxococcota bacterium]MBU1431138.1 SDR family NAD(P)-dependent oxidoreductase [Myxococcota bacterium]MBU1899772.1 SDR family NAD(P)-dependent oxidoreductase [Myxococcota bacterium]